MEIAGCGQCNENNLEILFNMLRILNMLEKAVERLGRKNFHSKAEYPGILIELESHINQICSWINGYKYFCGVPTFISTIGFFIANIGQITVELSNQIQPQKGKRKEKKSRLEKERENIFKSIQCMMEHLSVVFGELKPSETAVGIEIEKAL